MGLFELFLVAVGLSMDAFAVSVCKGLSLGKIRKNICVLPDYGLADFRQVCLFWDTFWGISFRT